MTHYTKTMCLILDLTCHPAYQIYPLLLFKPLLFSSLPLLNYNTSSADDSQALTNDRPYKYKLSLNFAKIIKFPLDNTPKAKYTKGVFFIRF